jgi:hypothetical protein
MPAMSALRSVSDSYHLEWNENSMLVLACQYIDNQCDDDAFFDFLRMRAEEEQVDVEI